MWWRYPHNPSAYDDDWEDQPSQGWFYQWILGLAVPGLLLAYGIRAILARSAEFGNQQQSLPLHGPSAIALGTAAISLGAFMHFHYFWGNVYSQVWWAVVGKIVSAIGFIAGLGTLIVRVGIFRAT